MKPISRHPLVYAYWVWIALSVPFGLYIANISSFESVIFQIFCIGLSLSPIFLHIFILEYRSTALQLTICLLYGGIIAAISYISGIEQAYYKNDLLAVFYKIPSLFLPVVAFIFCSIEFQFGPNVTDHEMDK